MEKFKWHTYISQRNETNSLVHPSPFAAVPAQLLLPPFRHPERAGTTGLLQTGIISGRIPGER